MTIFCLPELVLAAWACCLLAGEAVFRLPAARTALWAVAGLAVTLVIVLALPTGGIASSLWNGAYVWDGSAKFFKALFLLIAVAVVAMQWPRKNGTDDSGETFILPLFVVCGMLLLASAANLLLLFVALELVTITFYILVAYPPRAGVQLEAGAKYLILGALSSAFLVMGIAYLYGATGSFQFEALRQAGALPEVSLFLKIGLALTLAGVAFKVAAVPFHWWAPDVYQGAPTPVTAFLATASKAAGFAVILRLLENVLHVPHAGEWTRCLVGGLALASLAWGNLAALGQRSLKRLLAYSSIGHTGYLLIGIAVGTPLATSAVGTYLVAYAAASLAAFWVIHALAPQLGGDDLHRWTGLHRRHPLGAATLAAALLSLAGIPPLFGFVGKLGIFAAAWDAHAYGLAVAGIIAAIVGLFYYLNVIRILYWSEPIESQSLSTEEMEKAAWIFLTIVLMVGGIGAGVASAWIQALTGG